MSNPTPLNGIAALTNWGVIRAHGADAAAFLHAQLTNDISGLGADRACLAGYCSVKGRLLASFVVWRPSPDEVLLACHASVLAPTLKRLSMFVMRARCKLSDASGELSLYGIAGDAAGPWADTGSPWERRAAGNGSAVRLPDAAGLPRVLLATAEAPPQLPALALDDWRWLEVQSGVAVIESATAEQFVPQMLNFELVGGVNFQKGCYPGQEIVARSQYRGTIKRRTMLFDTDASVAPGAEIFHSADPGQPAGQVANAAPNPGGGTSLLGEVKLAAIGDGSLHLGSADGAVLLRRELPYALSAEADAAV